MDLFRIWLPIADTEFNILALLGTGFAVGVLGGFFGIGGGWIVTPTLNILGFPMPMAIGTGLANMTGQSTIAGIKHRRMGNVDCPLGVITGLCMLGGVEVGARVVMRLEALALADTAVRCIYMLLLTSVGGYMLWEYTWGHARGPQREGVHEGGPQRAKNAGLLTGVRSLALPPMIRIKGADARVSLWVVVVIGFGTGLLAGIMGVGGGLALVPAFVYLLGLPTAVAVGTSLVCVLIAGSYGAFTYGLKGRLALVAALLLLVGAAFGAQIGASAVRYVTGRGVRCLYSVMLLMAAFAILLMQLGHTTPAAVTILGGGLLMCIVIVSRALAGRRGQGAPHPSGGRE